MNFANYSPYNKSYKFICFQNQAYHQKNKQNAHPHVKTNIRYINSFRNPQSFSQRRSQSQSSHRISRSNLSDMNSTQHASMMRSSSLSSAIVSQNKRVIHKNQSYQKFRLRKISHQNIQMVNRLLQTQCQVIKNNQTQKSYLNHLKYRDIRKKYNDQGNRKTKMCLGNSQLLCPTLSQYNKSGLAQKFVQLDLSMSMTPSTPNSRMRKRKSDAPYSSQQDIQQVI